MIEKENIKRTNEEINLKKNETSFSKKKRKRLIENDENQQNNHQNDEQNNYQDNKGNCSIF